MQGLVSSGPARSEGPRAVSPKKGGEAPHFQGERMGRVRGWKGLGKSIQVSLAGLAGLADFLVA